MDYAKLDRALRAARQRPTAVRHIIYSALRGEEPLAMRELITRCSGVDRASVYRGVALFERLGIVQRLQSGWKYKLELTGEYHEHHHHATCLGCGRSLVLPEDEVLEQYLRQAAAQIGFGLERHQLELQGYCMECQNDAKRPKPTTNELN